MIRLATLDDVQSIASLGVLFHSEHPLSTIIPYNHAHIVQVTSGLIMSDSACVYVYDTPQGIVGMIAGILTPVLFNPTQQVVSEIVWYVHPTYRKGSTGIRLLNSLEQWAQSTSAVGIVMNAHSNFPGIARIYDARGYTPHEISYVKAL